LDVVIGARLVLTRTAFFTGSRQYPIGWIVLSAALIGRWLYLKARAHLRLLASAACQESLGGPE
jgi:dihydroxy-acid dehydratase